MRKMALICFFTVMGLSGVHAGMGIGMVYGGGPSSWSYRGYHNSLGLSLGFGSVQEVKWEMGIRMWFQGKDDNFYMRLALDADWHVLRKNLTKWFQLYAGVGPYVKTGFYTHPNVGSANLDIGARVPLGMRFMIGQTFDIWLAMVPALGLDMTFRDSGTSVGFGGGVGGEFGVRIWF